MEDKMTTRKRIILILEEHNGEIQGTAALALALGLINSKTYVLQSARTLQNDKQIIIQHSNGGRGVKSIYRRYSSMPEKRCHRRKA